MRLQGTGIRGYHNGTFHDLPNAIIPVPAGSGKLAIELADRLVGLGGLAGLVGLKVGFPLILQLLHPLLPLGELLVLLALLGLLYPGIRVADLEPRLGQAVC